MIHNGFTRYSYSHEKIAVDLKHSSFWPSADVKPVENNTMPSNAIAVNVLFYLSMCILQSLGQANICKAVLPTRRLVKTTLKKLLKVRTIVYLCCSVSDVEKEFYCTATWWLPKLQCSMHWKRRWKFSVKVCEVGAWTQDFNFVKDIVNLISAQ